MNIRVCGAPLLAIAVIALQLMVRLVTTLPHHQPTAIEMLLSLAAVAAAVSGAATVIIGPPLFQPHEWPPRDGGDRK
jgi:hypothetical protein